MNWTSIHLADALFLTGYAIWFALLTWRRLRAPAMLLLPLTDRLRELGLGVLLLPLVTALPGLWGTFGQLVAMTAPGVALAFWTFAPRYVSSKVVPLAFVADGIYGFERLRWNLRNFYPGPHARLSFYPQFLLLEAWAMLAVGLWLTWRAADPNSAAARVILREKGQLPGRRGRPRWGLLLLPVLVLVVELLGKTYWLGIPWWGAVPTLAVSAAVVLLVICAPKTAGTWPSPA